MEIILLRESLMPTQANIVTESSKDGKTCWLNGIFMMAEAANRNGRTYDKGELTSAVEAANTLIKETSGLLGELDHPENRLTVALDRVSHVITEMWMVGNNAHGKAKLIDTPMGDIAKTVINAGVKLGVSSRGTGQVQEGSGRVSNFALNTVDIVVTPSAQQAYPSTIYESLEQYKSGKSVLTLAEAARQDKSAQKYFQSAIMKFLTDLQPLKVK